MKEQIHVLGLFGGREILGSEGEKFGNSNHPGPCHSFWVQGGGECVLVPTHLHRIANDGSISLGREPQHRERWQGEGATQNPKKFGTFCKGVDKDPNTLLTPRIFLKTLDGVNSCTCLGAGGHQEGGNCTCTLHHCLFFLQSLRKCYVGHRW